MTSTSGTFANFPIWALLATLQIRTVRSYSPETMEITTVVDNRVEMPCNITMKADDAVTLIFWYKSANATGPPLFTVDARTVPPNHFVSDAYKHRTHFNVSVRPAVLAIEPVNQQDSGEYSCRVDYKWSRTTISNVRLHVVVPPRGMYIKDGEGQPVYAIGGPYEEDSRLQLTCVAENGRPAPRVVWYLDDTVIDDSYTVFGSEANFSFNSATVVENEIVIKRLGRRYFNSVLTCQAVNKHYSLIPVSASLRIDMNLKPVKVKIVTSIQPLIAGRKVDLLCLSFGSKPAAKVSWLLKEKELSRTRVTHSIDGNITTNSLTFIPTPEDNLEVLVCRVRNPKISNYFLEDSVELNVHYKPRLNLVLKESPQLVSKGNEAQLDCLIKANPPVLGVVWFFNRSPIESVLHPEVVVKNASLVVKRLDPEKHEGAYQCLASNSEGTGTSNLLPLTVFYPPFCKLSGLSYEVSLGSSVEIKCELDAAPPSNLSFQWTLFSSSPLSPSSPSSATSSPSAPASSGSSPPASPRAAPRPLPPPPSLPPHSPVPFSETNLENFIVNGLQSILYFRPNSSRDYGHVYCTAINMAGDQLDPCSFAVRAPLGPPSAPFDCKVFNQTRTYFLVECKFDPESDCFLPAPGSGSGSGAGSASPVPGAAEHELQQEEETKESSLDSVEGCLPTIYFLDIYEFEAEKGEKLALVSLEEEERPTFRVFLSNLKSLQKERTFQYILVIYAKNSRGNSSFVEITLEMETQLMLNRVSNYSSSAGDESSSFQSNHVLLSIGTVIVILVLVLVLFATQLKFQCVFCGKKGAEEGSRRGRKKKSKRKKMEMKMKMKQRLEEESRGSGNGGGGGLMKGWSREATSGLSPKSETIRATLTEAPPGLEVASKSDPRTPDIIQLSTDSLHVVIVKPRVELEFYDDDLEEEQEFAGGGGRGGGGGIRMMNPHNSHISHENAQTLPTMPRVFSVSTPV